LHQVLTTMTVTLYHYDKGGSYIGSSAAEMSPRQPDVPLVPACATLEEPPAAGPGQVALFIDGAWMLGEVPAEGAEPIVLPVLTPEEQIAAFTKAVQAMLDAQARSMGYDNIFTAVTYADEPVVPSFQSEGRSLRAWRSLTWQACHSALDAVTAGERAVPTINELLAELPVFQLLPVDAQAEQPA